MSARSEGVARAAPVVLLAAAIYEALVVLEVVPLGSRPGDGAPGEGIASGVAAVAYLAGATAAFGHACERDARPALVWMAPPLAGVAFVTVRWYGFDPYYLPTLRPVLDEHGAGRVDRPSRRRRNARRRLRFPPPSSGRGPHVRAAGRVAALGVVAARRE